MTVKAARILAGLRQADMAKKLGVCRDTYIKYEKNPDLIPIGMAKKIAVVTGRTIDEIFLPNDSTVCR